MEESDASDLDDAYGSVRVEDLQGNAIALDDSDEEAELVAVQVWNPGCSNSTAWTGKTLPKVKFRNADGDVVEGNKRDIFLRHVISKVITGGSEMICLVDCGVEGLDAELQAIVNYFNGQKPNIQVHNIKSYLFIHTGSLVV